MIYSTTNSSKYCYHGTDILKNKFDLKNQEVLTQIEADFTLNRLAELHISPITGDFSLNHLSKIHKYIFGDIYPFAGKTRNENIIKNNTRFCSFEYIYENFNKMHSSLQNDNFLKGLEIQDFCEKLAYYMSELNMIHPYREGNGRSTREYIRCLALYNNFIINWDAIDRNCLIEAIIASVDKDYKPLIECIYNSIEK